MTSPPTNPNSDAAQPMRQDDLRQAKWADSTHSYLFDESGFQPMQAARQMAAQARDGVFDLCHVGMVLRAVLLVEAVLALGILFVASDETDFAVRLSLGSALGLPAVLLWLSVTCALRRQLSAQGAVRQCLMTALLGAASGGVGWATMHWAAQGVISVVPWFAPVASGAFMATMLTLWLQQRERGRLPADASARLAELQSRIRPHFLFNTLNSALGLVRRDPVRAEALLEDLSELFRSALATDASTVSLGDEIELARRYLAIEQIRFGSRLQVVWKLDPLAAGAPVPPLLLQPLVENAVRHGVEPDANGGVIRITSQVRRGQACLSITNSLPGRSAAKASAGQGMALGNVRERLRLMHDVAARFQIDADERRFRIQLAVPLNADNAGKPS